jgi:hypothetical protein
MAHKSQVFVCVSMANTLPRARLQCTADFIFSLVCPPCAVYMVDELVGDTRENAFPPPRAEGNSCCGKRGCRKLDPCYDENIDCNFLERKYTMKS